jgi:outer membrane protein
MRKLIVTIAVAMFLATGFSFAQKTLKIGHINGQELLSLMPERTKAEADIKAFAEQLGKDIEILQVELNNKINDYQNNEKTYSDLIKQSKVEEIQNLQTRIQEYQRTAQQTLQKKEGELLKPIMEKAQNAIKEVAKANKFTYILDTSAGSVLYQSDDSIDIMDLVKAKLGIK